MREVACGFTVHVGKCTPHDESRPTRDANRSGCGRRRQRHNLLNDLLLSGLVDIRLLIGAGPMTPERVA